MPPSVDPDVLRILVDLVRDQGAVLAEVAKTGAVSADRQAQVVLVLQRLDAFLARQEAGVAAVQASVDAGKREERAALTKLYRAVTQGLQSSTVQRLVFQPAILLAMGLLYSHYGLQLPLPFLTGASP